MSEYISDKDILNFNPQAGAAIVTVPATPLVVTSSKGLVTGMKKELAVYNDLKNVKIAAVYITAAGHVGGTGSVTAEKWSKISKVTLKKNKGVLIQGGTGTYKFSVLTPAVNPAGVLDVIPSYSGTFTITSIQKVFTEK